MLWAVFLDQCTNDAINFRWIRFLFGTMHRKIPRLQMSEWQLLIPSYIISNNMYLYCETERVLIVVITSYIIMRPREYYRR